MQTIVGAGLSGLIAAHSWRVADIFEERAHPGENHKALLRFRTNEVAVLTGIPFRAVTVRKGIWDHELRTFVKPSIQLANAYSKKVIGRVVNDRSIWNLEPVERFIAPEDFYDQLLSHVGNRVAWGQSFNLRGTSPDNPAVVTAPLPSILNALDITLDIGFRCAPITVRRYRIPDCDVYQTVYVPDERLNLYRMSITGSMLIMESIQREVQHHTDPAVELQQAVHAFGLGDNKLRIVTLDEHTQRFGKIAPIDNALRRGMLARLSQEHGIFTLGRFATWRNSLLDDLPKDIGVIRDLIANDTYATRLMAAR